MCCPGRDLQLLGCHTGVGYSLCGSPGLLQVNSAVSADHAWFKQCLTQNHAPVPCSTFFHTAMCCLHLLCKTPPCNMSQEDDTTGVKVRCRGLLWKR